LKGLDEARVVRCDEATWRLFGLSFAGWNALISLMLFALSLQAAFAASARE
jgi:disulfide bond formation protein DsbB